MRNEAGGRIPHSEFRIPHFKVIHQPNRGLSTARNAGLRAATGEVIAYTDSDCFADPDWLTLLVRQLERSGAVAVGGPNLTPEDGRLAACVAAAPGQPMHVLESDQVAEHIPGCNMAFRRAALEAINGFDPQYRKAGDDVDVCWRLQGAQARLTPGHEGFTSRLLVTALCYAQPLVRSWSRYRTRLLAYRPPASPTLPGARGQRLPLSGEATAAYWSEEGYERTELLG